MDKGKERALLSLSLSFRLSPCPYIIAVAAFLRMNNQEHAAQKQQQAEQLYI